MSKNKLYIASTLSNYRYIGELAAMIKSTAANQHQPVEITYAWWDHSGGEMPYVADDDLERKIQVAEAELEGVRAADVVLIVMPGGFGTHFEFGAAYALKKTIIFFDGRSDVSNRPSFHHLRDLHRTYSLGETLTKLFSVLS
jgi:nucleoside 2-deoxyribosyltransferase